MADPHLRAPYHPVSLSKPHTPKAEHCLLYTRDDIPDLDLTAEVSQLKKVKKSVEAAVR